MTCPDCEGYGVTLVLIDDEPGGAEKCPTCKGSGEIPNE